MNTELSLSSFGPNQEGARLRISGSGEIGWEVVKQVGGEVPGVEPLALPGWGDASEREKGDRSESSPGAGRRVSNSGQFTRFVPKAGNFWKLMILCSKKMTFLWAREGNDFRRGSERGGRRGPPLERGDS